MNRNSWLLILSLIGFVGCGDTKTVWLTGYIKGHHRSTMSVPFDYKTFEEGKEVKKKQRLSLRTNRFFLVRIKEENIININVFELSDFGKPKLSISELKQRLIFGDSKFKIVYLGVFYEYDVPTIRVPKDFDGQLSDFRFDIVSDVPNVDYFNMRISTASKPYIIESSYLAYDTNDIISIKGLKTPQVFFKDYIDFLSPPFHSFELEDGAKVTIYDGFKPGSYSISGSAIRVIRGNPVEIASVMKFFEIPDKK